MFLLLLGPRSGNSDGFFPPAHLVGDHDDVHAGTELEGRFVFPHFSPSRAQKLVKFDSPSRLGMWSSRTRARGQMKRARKKRTRLEKKNHILSDPIAPLRCFPSPFLLPHKLRKTFVANQTRKKNTQEKKKTLRPLFLYVHKKKMFFKQWGKTVFYCFCAG